MDILIIGGTTFFGRDIVELALAAGHHVTVFSRGNQKPDFWDHIKHIEGDRHIQAEVTRKLKGLRFDVVVECDGEAIYHEVSQNEDTALERATEIRHALGPEAVTIEWRG